MGEQFGIADTRQRFAQVVVLAGGQDNGCGHKGSSHGAPPNLIHSGHAGNAAVPENGLPLQRGEVWSRSDW